MNWKFWKKKPKQPKELKPFKKKDTVDMKLAKIVEEQNRLNMRMDGIDNVFKRIRNRIGI